MSPIPSLPSPPSLKFIFCSENFSFFYKNSHRETLSKNDTQALESANVRKIRQIVRTSRSMTFVYETLLRGRGVIQRDSHKGYNGDRM